MTALTDLPRPGVVYVMTQYEKDDKPRVRSVASLHGVDETDPDADNVAFLARRNPHAIYFVYEEPEGEGVAEDEVGPYGRCDTCGAECYLDINGWPNPTVYCSVNKAHAVALSGTEKGGATSSTVTIPDGARFYRAGVDEYGVLLVDQMHDEADEDATAGTAEAYTDMIYFYVEAPVKPVEVTVSLPQEVVDWLSRDWKDLGYGVEALVMSVYEAKGPVTVDPPRPIGVPADEMFVNYYISKDTGKGMPAEATTWSVYQEFYANADDDEPIDGTQFRVHKGCVNERAAMAARDRAFKAARARGQNVVAS